MTQHTFHMPNDIQDVDPTVVSLKAVAEGVLEVDALIRLEICVSEALTNIVKHARVNDKSQPIDVLLIAATDNVLVEIYEPVGTEPFDIRDHAPDLSEVDLAAETGRGLGLIMQCADRVDYVPSADRNKLTLSFSK